MYTNLNCNILILIFFFSLLFFNKNHWKHSIFFNWSSY